MTPRSGRRPLAGLGGSVADHRASADPFGAAPAWVERVVAGDRPAGPRGRLGVLWFAVAVLAAAIGLFTLSLLFAAVAAVAALQTVAAWRRARSTPIRAAAAAGAGLLPISAAFGIALVGLFVLLAVAGALVAAVLTDRERRRDGGGGRPEVLGLAGLVVRVGIVPGLAAASAVLVARTDGASFVVLLVLISGYELGDYLVGTGAGSRIEGPVAGIAAVLVLTFGVAVYQLAAFDTVAAWVFGGLVAVTAPLGPLVAAALVPTATAVGPALRRLDSWIVTAPLWAWMLWDYTG
jgi:hypothetical protein